MPRNWMPLLTLTLFAAGCGGSYCKTTAKQAEDCGYEMNDADIEACETSLEGCSASDEKKLTKFTDCIGGPCGFEDMGTADLFGLLSCAAELDGISPDCAAVTGFDSTFSTTWSSSSWTSSSSTTTP